MANWFKAAENFLNKVDQAAVKLKDRGLTSDSEYSESDRESSRGEKSHQLDHGYASSSSVISSNELPAVPRTPTTSKGILPTRQSRPSPSQQPLNQRPKESPRTSRKLSSASGGSGAYESETGGNEDWTELLGSGDAGSSKGSPAMPPLLVRSSSSAGRSTPDTSKRSTPAAKGKAQTAATPSTRPQTGKAVTPKAVSSSPAGKLLPGAGASSPSATSSPRHGASPGGIRGTRPGGAMSMRGLDSSMTTVLAPQVEVSPSEQKPEASAEVSIDSPTTGSHDIVPVGAAVVTGRGTQAEHPPAQANLAAPHHPAGTVAGPSVEVWKAREGGEGKSEEREGAGEIQPVEVTTEAKGVGDAGEKQASADAVVVSSSSSMAAYQTGIQEGQIQSPPPPPPSVSSEIQEDLLDVYLSRMLVGQVAVEGTPGAQGGGDGEGSSQGVDAGAKEMVSGVDVEGSVEGESKKAGVAQPRPLSASRSGESSKSTSTVAEEIKRKVLAADELARSLEENGGKRRAARSGKSGPGEDSDSESGSGSDTSSDDSDGGSALQRARADREVREKAAAIATAVSRENAAVEAARAAVAEREALVEALSAEKETLQREAVEASTQHAQEIARLRDTMTEGMQAVQVEKHAHSSTRMDALDRESSLETENLEQAKALAAAQRALDEEVSRAMVARTGIGKCEAARAAMQMELAALRKQLEMPQQSRDLALETARALMSEGASIAEELSSVAAKIEKKQEEVREVEERLVLAKATRRQPSALERELDGRLGQLTDHLIQKQSQVEELQSDKATLALRLETSTASLQEEKASAASSRRTAKIRAAMASSAAQGWADDDLEFGGGSQAYYASGKGKSGRRYYAQDDFGQGGLSSIFGRGARALDSYVLRATRFLRMHGSVRALLLIYLLALHGWVVVVFLLHSKTAPNV